MFKSQAVKRHFHDPPYHSKLKSFIAFISSTMTKVKAVAGLAGRGKAPDKAPGRAAVKTPGADNKFGAGAVKREKPQGQIFVSGRDRMDRDGRMKLDAQVGLGRTVDGRSMGMNQRQQTKSSPKKSQPNSPKKSQLTDQQKAEQTAKDKRAEKRLTELLGSAEFAEGRVSSDEPASVNASMPGAVHA